MNEQDTREELIGPKLKECGWGEIEDSQVRREFRITPGKIQMGGKRASSLKADYVLVYRGRELAVVEAKRIDLGVEQGVAQAKEYAKLLEVDTTFSTNGKEIYQICMKSGKEGRVERFPTPIELWQKSFAEQNDWRNKFDHVEAQRGKFENRFYQKLAINRVLDAIANKKKRILLTMATGTGKTAVAFQIVWKLFQSRWNLKWDGRARPRILFLVDRNFLADQTSNSFCAFPEDSLVRIRPDQIRKRKKVMTGGDIFFTIFQTFMSGENPYYKEYRKDFFDFIIIDECHRGGANDESEWREILEYFSPAVQLGLTATPKRKENADTYRYFGHPVYSYSLKDGINHGFLTPFKVKRIKTTIDDYVYSPDDDILEGEVEKGRRYEEEDFNNIIEIKQREAKRVEIMFKYINQSEKTLVFCANQHHAAVIRDLINQKKKNGEVDYCKRVTSDEGEIGEQYLRDFQDNEKTIPTILTTSRKLSTGVDARNIRNIVLLRPIKSMIEFKQIIGRGTRVFDGKEYFSILDFVDACRHFSDPDWDGEAIDVKDLDEPEDSRKKFSQQPSQGKQPKEPNDLDYGPKKKLKIKLADGKEREIQHTMQTLFWDTEGKPISIDEFLIKLYGKLPEFFKSEKELRQLWSSPNTREELLKKLDEVGFGREQLNSLRVAIDANKCDLFDVLEYVAFHTRPMTRRERVEHAKSNIFSSLNKEQREFINFVLEQYVESGVEELSEENLPELLKLKYQTLADTPRPLGDIPQIKFFFVDFQKHLYHQHL